MNKEFGENALLRIHIFNVILFLSFENVSIFDETFTVYT